MSRYRINVRGDLPLTLEEPSALIHLADKLNSFMGSYRPDSPRVVAAHLLDGLDNPETTSTHFYPDIEVEKVPPTT